MGMLLMVSTLYFICNPFHFRFANNLDTLSKSPATSTQGVESDINTYILYKHIYFSKYAITYTFSYEIRRYSK